MSSVCCAAGITIVASRITSVVVGTQHRLTAADASVVMILVLLLGPVRCNAPAGRRRQPQQPRPGDGARPVPAPRWRPPQRTRLHPRPPRSVAAHPTSQLRLATSAPLSRRDFEHHQFVPDTSAADEDATQTHSLL